jgi:7,8-dihydropterin-6-yl-methyl-4-(beta-D-ribofuranosyl)aminobenzene 5'-phosphate synthase
MQKLIVPIFLIGLLIIVGIFIQKEPEFEKPKTMEEKKLKSKEGEIEIITLYDNYQFNPQLKTDWGFSCLIRQGSKGEGGLSILFDTGADSGTLISNAEKMSLDSKEIDIIVLSHIHGDHTGGLEGILKIHSNPSVYLPQSFPQNFKDRVKSYGAEIIEVKEPGKISDNVYSTGELGTYLKEQSLIVDSHRGLIIITGCAHPGIVNIIKAAKEIFPEKNIYLVLGGFHLAGTPDAELSKIIQDFRKLGVEKVAPCHCSGDRTRELFKKEYQDNFIENGVGRKIEI